MRGVWVAELCLETSDTRIQVLSHTAFGRLPTRGCPSAWQSMNPTDHYWVTSVFLGPQINYTWSSRLSAMVGADLPVSIQSTGDQLAPDNRVHGAVTWRF